MPYRHAGQGLCAVCNSFTSDDGCPRCGRTLCAVHAPEHTTRCTECEAEYVQVAALLRSVPVVLLALRVGVVVFVCMVMILVGQLEAMYEIGPCLSFAGGAMTVIFLVSLGVLLRRRRLLREHFLAEQGGRPLRPSNGPVVVEQPAFLTPVRW